MRPVAKVLLVPSGVYLKTEVPSAQKRLPAASKAKLPAWELMEAKIVPKQAIVTAINNFFIYSDTSVFVFPTFFTEA